MIFKLLSLLLITSSTFAMAEDGVDLSNLRVGECTHDLKHKSYLSNNLAAPRPKVVEFVCSYMCRNRNNQIEQVMGTSVVSISSLNDENFRMVCQGVKIKKTTWGFDVDRVEKFYAHDTRAVEVKMWASEHINYFGEVENEKLIKLRDQFYTQGITYLKSIDIVKYPAYKEIAEELFSIAGELPGNLTKLEIAIETYVKNHDAENYSDIKSRVMHGILISMAGWRVPLAYFQN